MNSALRRTSRVILIVSTNLAVFIIPILLAELDMRVKYPCPNFLKCIRA
jgi:hypothetical protein